ncbi:hypothetical protein Leryth_016055 [Lithospermum erythrorhizon]|nr:hypothetical protein Leryth_016055 [Lithospermum erythrorhizon]
MWRGEWVSSYESPASTRGLPRWPLTEVDILTMDAFKPLLMRPFETLGDASWTGGDFRTRP